MKGCIAGDKFLMGANTMWHRRVGSIVFRSHAVIEDWMILFTAYAAAETLMLLNQGSHASLKVLEI